MKIYRIILTGGPCAGKTTILNAVNKYLKNKNIPFVTIPETATELIINGITPESMSAYDFQDIVIKRQLNKERDAEEYFQNHFANHDKCVIIYDRGIFDNAAYMDETGFQNLLSKYNLMSMFHMDKYDLVLDLLSVASCKKEAYNLDNEARKENVSEAEILDTKTANAWANHHNLKLLNSKVPMEDEIRTAIDYINDALNEVEHQEKMKYLINLFQSDLTIYKNIPKIDVTEQLFNVGLPQNYHFMISKRNTFGHSYVLTIYQEIANKVLTLYNKTIDNDTFEYLYNNYELLQQNTKKEINFIANQTLYRLSLYSDKTYLEIQNNTANYEYIIPECIHTYSNPIIEIKNHRDVRNYVKKLIK